MGGAIRASIDNEFLRRALRNFAAAYPAAREKAFEGIDFEALRNRVSTQKRESLSRLSELVREFTENAEACGARVHLCTTGEEACRTIGKIIRSAGVDSLIKSKSMTSEEIGLNHRLDGEGIRSLETDLGEWIIQLAGERPSHMVMPAIHKNREEVACLFTKATGRECAPHIPSLVETARETLRSAFLQAEVGLSGANAAIADSGTLMIVTNEGNGRLVTTLPRVHIALVGIEKIVPTLSNALDLLEILPRNATGQKITSYVSLIRGKGDGDRELHVILLDNGRFSLSSHPRYAEALHCVRCGACANVCPVYGVVGGHVFGHVYVGGIGLVFTPFFHGFEKGRELLGLCIGCRKCNEVCAAKIDIEGIILDLRTEMEKPFGQTLLFSSMMKNRTLFHGALRAAYLAQKPLQGQDGRIRHLPLLFDHSSAGKSLPPIAEIPYREMVRRRTPAKEGTRVSFFAGCLADFVYPDLCRDASDSLERLGYSVSFPQKQSCCGIPARYAGEMGVAQEMARMTIDLLLEDGGERVVTICPTCTMALKHDFPRILSRDPHYAERAALLSSRVFHHVELAARRIGDGWGGSRGRGEVAYHDACHLRRGCGVVEEPRRVLREMVGVNLREINDSDTCCGFGGSYSLKYPEISRELLKNKIDSIRQSGAAVVAVDCPGCKLQIEGGIELAGIPVTVEHTATLLAKSQEGSPAGGGEPTEE
ncbi:MAG: LUD domain-containing protein [Desulfuromonadia bacterium]